MRTGDGDVVNISPKAQVGGGRWKMGVGWTGLGVDD